MTSQMAEKGEQMEKDKSNMDGRNLPVKTKETGNLQIQANREDAERVISPASLPISGVRAEGEPGESSSESSESVSRVGDSSSPPESSDTGAGGSSSPTESSQSTSGAGDSLSPDESSESTSGVVASSSSVGSTDATSGVEPSRSVSADATSGVGASLSSVASADANSGVEDSLSSIESADSTPAVRASHSSAASTNTSIVSAGDSDSGTSLDPRPKEEFTILTETIKASEETSESNESAVGSMPSSVTSAKPKDDNPLLRKMLSLDTSESSSKSLGVSPLVASTPRLVGMLTSEHSTESEDQNPIPSDLIEQMQQQMQQDMISPQGGNRSLGLGSRTSSTTSDDFGACSVPKIRRASEDTDQIVPDGDTKSYIPAPFSFVSSESSSDSVLQSVGSSPLAPLDSVGDSVSESVGSSPLAPPDSGVQGAEVSSGVQGAEVSSGVQGAEVSSRVQEEEGNNFEGEQEATCSTDGTTQERKRMCGESEEESSNEDSGLPRSPKKKLTTEPPLAPPQSGVDCQEGSSGVQGAEGNEESKKEATNDENLELPASPAEKSTTKTPNPPKPDEPEDKN